MKKSEFLKGFHETIALIREGKRESILPEKAAEVSKMLHTDQDIEDSKCGIGFFKPRWLQHLSRKEIYILVYCFVGIVQGMFFSYTVSVLTTIEKRFKLTSKQSGIFLAGNDISQIIFGVLLGYYGNYGHRPRWMAIGITITAVSGFFASFPHFFYGPGQDAIDIVRVSTTRKAIDDGFSIITNNTVKEKQQELCWSLPDDTCGGDDSLQESYIGPIIIFFVSQFCVGITVALFYSIGVTYLDDNVNKKVYPIYYAISLMLRVLGPVAGYFVGGKCLSVWIDPNETPNLTRKDPRWYGAWWIGYVFMGCSLLLAGSMMVLFPRKMPATLRRESKRVVRQARKEEELGGIRDIDYFVTLAKTTKAAQDQPTMKNLWRAFRRLYTNKIWLATMFNTVVSLFGGASYWYFKPKYLENQFRKSASESSYYAGLVGLVSLIFGTGLGGVVMRWVRPGPRVAAGYNIFITCIGISSYLIKMFIGCPKLDLVGPVNGAVPPPCSLSCGCTDRFTPMCSQDGTTLFYSPCYAGCQVANTTASPIVYSDCLCITNSTDPLNNIFPSNDLSNYNMTFGYGVSGYCDEPCTTFPYFIIMETLVRIVEATGRVSNSLIFIRCTSDEDKSLSLALMTVFLSLFAFIPAPIAMGSIVDSVCIVWDKTCGKYGNCWLYDADMLRYIMHLVPGALVLVSMLGDIVVFRHSHTLDLYGDRENNLGVEKQEEDGLKSKETHEDKEEEEEWDKKDKMYKAESLAIMEKDEKIDDRRGSCP